MKLINNLHNERIYSYIDDGQRRYIGYTLLYDRLKILARELNAMRMSECEIGSDEAFDNYQKLTEVARNIGIRSRAGLVDSLIGLEGKRVRVISINDFELEFTVCITSEIIPEHVDERGQRVTGYPYKKVTVLENS